MIKKFVMFLFILLFYSFIMAKAGYAEGDMAHGAKVYFYRLNNYVGSAIKMKILANDLPITRIRNGSYFVYEAQPGDYYFSCSMGNESRIKLTLEPGKEYFIKCYLAQGFWSGIPQLELVESVSGRSVIEGGQLKELVQEEISMERPKSNIGFLIGFGGGFESIPLFYDQNNKNVTLSTGGGRVYGANYGYRFSRHFELTAEGSFQTSSLTPQLNNATASFNRMVLCLTPNLVLPVKSNDYLRFKLGAGLGFYGFGTMKIDASKAGGSIYRFYYQPQLGAHVAANFEFNFSDRGSMSFGLKYYNVNYQYSHSSTLHFPTDILLEKPNGSGIDFVLGYYYHF